MQTTKVCPMCKQELLATAFSKRHKDNPGLLATYCNPCAKIYAASFRKRHRGKRFYADTLTEYIAQHVTPLSPEKCWEWQGRCAPNGYGEACFKRERRSAHVFAYIEHYGPIADSVHILHACDNRSCCSWHHLFPGNADLNNKDRAKKGRGVVRVTREQIITARQLRTQGIAVKQISRMLDIPYSTVHYMLQPGTHPYIK